MAMTSPCIGETYQLSMAIPVATPMVFPDFISIAVVEKWNEIIGDGCGVVAQPGVEGSRLEALKCVKRVHV